MKEQENKMVGYEVLPCQKCLEVNKCGFWGIYFIRIGNTVSLHVHNDHDYYSSEQKAKIALAEMIIESNM